MNFSFQREVMRNHENRQGIAYRVRRPALRVSMKNRHAGAILFADFAWIKIGVQKERPAPQQTAFRDIMQLSLLRINFFCFPRSL